jgi:hypothetical protein
LPSSDAPEPAAVLKFQPDKFKVAGERKAKLALQTRILTLRKSSYGISMTPKLVGCSISNVKYVDICKAFDVEIPEGCAPDYVSKRKFKRKRGRSRKRRRNITHEEFLV